MAPGIAGLLAGRDEGREIGAIARGTGTDPVRWRREGIGLGALRERKKEEEADIETGIGIRTPGAAGVVLAGHLIDPHAVGIEIKDVTRGRRVNPSVRAQSPRVEALIIRNLSWVTLRW